MILGELTPTLSQHIIPTSLAVLLAAYYLGLLPRYFTLPTRTMATVHPSRMGLVPQDPKDIYQDPRRGRSPPRRHDRDRRERDRDRGRECNDGSERGSGGNKERPDDRRDRRRDHDNDRTSPPRHKDNGRRPDNRDRGRHRERERDEDRDRDRSRSRRRGSPEYEDYKRPASPGPATPSLYPNRPPRDGTYERRGGYAGGGSEYLERCVDLPTWVNPHAEMLFESRRVQRESSTFSIWPPSPKAPARTLYVIISRLFISPV